MSYQRYHFYEQYRPLRFFLTLHSVSKVHGFFLRRALIYPRPASADREDQVEWFWIRKVLPRNECFSRLALRYRI